MNSSLRQELQRLPHGALVEQAAPANRVTGRAVLIGVLSIAFFSIINPYLSFVVRSWDVGSGQLMNGPVVALFVLVVLNTLLVRLWPGRAFSRAELLVVYGMMTVSLGLLEQGGLPYVVALVTYPFFAATPGNQFQDLIWPHIPAWFRTATPESTDWLWEGMPRGATIPWAAWTTPWLAWGAFTFALMGAMYCLAALLSRDWIQRQRLTFPLVEVPLAITGESERPVLGTSLMRSRAFWAGSRCPQRSPLLGGCTGSSPASPPPVSVSSISASRSRAWSYRGARSGTLTSLSSGRLSG